MSAHAGTGRATRLLCRMVGLREPWWITEAKAAADRYTARRRVLGLIATECPGQDVAGVVVIDDVLRIDFVSGCALLVGADGTLIWQRGGDGLVERSGTPASGGTT